MFASWLGNPQQADAAPPPPPPAATVEDPAAPPPVAEPAAASSMVLPTPPSFSLGGEPEASAAPHDEGPQYVPGRPNRGMQSFKVESPPPPPPSPLSPLPPAPPLSVPKRAVGADGKKRFTNPTQMKLFYMDGLEVRHSRALAREELLFPA